MVQYSDWVSIVFDVAKAQGYRASFGNNSEVVQVAAAIWNDRKAELQAASRSAARRVAEEEVTVS